jgi:hypothetical protein
MQMSWDLIGRLCSARQTDLPANLAAEAQHTHASIDRTGDSCLFGCRLLGTPVDLWMNLVPLDRSAIGSEQHVARVSVRRHRQAETKGGSLFDGSCLCPVQWGAPPGGRNLSRGGSVLLSQRYLTVIGALGLCRGGCCLLGQSASAAVVMFPAAPAEGFEPGGGR